jgi:hypothetical protein
MVAKRFRGALGFRHRIGESALRKLLIFAYSSGQARLKEQAYYYGGKHCAAGKVKYRNSCRESRNGQHNCKTETKEKYPCLKALKSTPDHR